MEFKNREILLLTRGPKAYLLKGSQTVSTLNDSSKKIIVI